MRHHQTAPLVQKTIELANHAGHEFAAPPADAAPKLTVQQAVDTYTGQSNFQVPDGVSVALGLLTRPIGPDIGPSSQKGDAVINGIAYEFYERLAYGFMRDFRPPGSTLPDWKGQQWLFLDANTGQHLEGLSPPPDRSHSAPAGPTA